MSEALRGVVVCHGALAKALVDAAESISGITGVLVPVSNSGCDRESLEDRVAEAVGDKPSVVFVDLASGSCLFAVLKRLRAMPAVRVVTGVNLAMLVDFVFQVSLTPEAAAERAIATGSKAIRTP
jgi:mannose/fructose-specific phosphotransferase system component IIA